jgi:hypothetical protein
MRLHLLQHPEPDLAEIAKDLHDRLLSDVQAMMEAAVARQELSREVDILLLLDMYWGALHTRLIMKDQTVDDAQLTRMVDILINAARPVRALPRTAAKQLRRR